MGPHRQMSRFGARNVLSPSVDLHVWRDCLAVRAPEKRMNPTNKHAMLAHDWLQGAVLPCVRVKTCHVP